MKRLSILVGVLLLTSVALAQSDYPKVETSPAFMYIRTPIDNVSFNCAGGGGTIAYNFTSVLGLAFDGGGCRYFGNTIGLGNTITGNDFTFMFGPRFTYRSDSRFQPFAEVNFGGNRISLTCKTGAVNCNALTGGATFSKTAFALTAGGGFDIKLNRKFALRLVQAEYLYTRFGNNCPLNFCNNNNNSQNSFRLKSGIVVGWGGSAKKDQ
jgi:opacity protein-like surface antigen